MVLPFKGIMYDGISYAHGQMPTASGRKAACSDIEMNLVECLEAYGMIKGSERCMKYAEDYQECKSAHIKDARAYMMKLERYKKIAKGELPLEARMGKPVPYDAYVCGVFSP